VSRRRKRRGHGEHVSHERWLVSYADFITLLFAFFTTMYAISTVDQKKAGRLMYSMRSAFNLDLLSGILAPPAPQRSVVPAVVPSPESPPSPPMPVTPSPRAQVLGRLEQRLLALGGDPRLSGKMQVRQEKRGLVVSLAEAGFFDSGSAAVRADAVAALARVAEEFVAEPVKISVEGHSDNLPVRGGRYASNWELSTARATAVIEFLILSAHIPADRLSAAGYGEHKPIASNDTVEGRARNRRVDIVLDPEL
jgi:chemotaxis protein MotB